VEQLVALGDPRARRIRVDDLRRPAEVGDVVQPERHPPAVVRLVAGQLERAERAREGKLLFIVDVALAANAQNRMLAHQVLDQADQRGIGRAQSTPRSSAANSGCSVLTSIPSRAFPPCDRY
jgi:hypothetical protein